MAVKKDSPLRRTKRHPLRRKAPEGVFTGPIRLDPFQEEAFKLLAGGHNVLVAAPTGTGKTLIAEMLIEKVLADGRGSVYTSPIKALSNQKYRDFADRFGKERVGLITGDVSVNERAPLLVMTTEIFRNWCFANPEMLDDMTHVIFDELHYLDDRERGTAWEESIIFAPPHIRIVGLSATVPNVHELASWIADVRGQPVKVIEERCRAVPLELSWISPEGHVLEEDEAREHIRQRIERRRGRWTDFPKNDAELAYE
ncbi:MAG: DEAD/DEAH box helicase [Bacillota bacterium]